MTSLQGHLLIARDLMGDSSFTKTVVLVLEHNEHGSLGVVLNRPTDMPIAKAWEQVSDIPCHSQELVHVGGPCDGPLMVLHVHPDHAQIDVLPGVHVATDQTDVQWVIEHSAAPTRYFIGYAGWEAGQLEGELLQGAWDTLPATIDHLFYSSQENLWERLSATVGRRARHADLPDKLIPKNPSDN